MTRSFILLSTALLSACALPKEATKNRADFRAAEADSAFADELDFTPVAQIPTGEATYEGQFQSDAIVDGRANFKLLGDLEMSVDLTEARTSRINGSITDVNLLDDANDGFDDQRLGGTLTLSGQTEGGRIDAQAIGVLDAVVTDTPIRQTSTWQLDLDGDFRSSFENADVVSGVVTGGTTGGVTDDYDVTLTGNGGFYAERTD